MKESYSTRKQNQSRNEEIDAHSPHTQLSSNINELSYSHATDANAKRIKMENKDLNSGKQGQIPNDKQIHSDSNEKPETNVQVQCINKQGAELNSQPLQNEEAKIDAPIISEESAVAEIIKLNIEFHSRERQFYEKELYELYKNGEDVAAYIAKINNARTQENAARKIENWMRYLQGEENYPFLEIMDWDDLREESHFQPVYLLNPSLPKGFTETGGWKKRSGYDEFLQSVNAKFYYDCDEDNKKQGNPTSYGVKQAFLEFRQGVNTFVHANSTAEKPISGHAGHLFNIEEAYAMKGGITGNSVKSKISYHTVRDNALYEDSKKTKLKELPLAIRDAMIAHIGYTYNYDKILQALIPVKGDITAKTAEEYKSLTSEEKLRACIFSSTGLVLPQDQVDFARVMQLNRDKMKIVSAALDNLNNENTVTFEKDIDTFLSTRNLSPLRAKSPISVTYVNNVIERVGKIRNLKGKAEKLTALGSITRERAPVIKRSSKGKQGQSPMK